MVTQRQADILTLIIGQYVDTAVPVPSVAISKAYQPAVSPATVRHEMAVLEGEGYLDHPHTSAGRIPTGRGYRYYVETLMEEEAPSWDAQQTVRHQFHQIDGGLEAWSQFAASVLAQWTESAALVTAPRADACRVKHVELVGLQDEAALLVLVLDQGRLRQQILRLDEPRPQEQLSASAAKLNELVEGKSLDEIADENVSLDPFEVAVLRAVKDGIRAIDAGAGDEAYLDGLKHILNQPEFAGGDRAADLVQVLAQRQLGTALPLSALAGEGVTVMIGGENPSVAGAPDPIRECSIVIGRYGVRGAGMGALAVVGPMRMRYSRAVSGVRYLSAMMSELLSAYYE
jgi:heat-inducible transcriptional repressor